MKSIKTKILALTTISILVSLSLVSTIFSVLSIKSTEHTLELALRETAETAAMAVQNSIQASKNTIQELGINRTIWDADAPPAERQALLAEICSSYGFQQVSTADANGKTADGEDISGQEFFQHALEGQTFMSVPLVSEDGKSARILVAAPVWSNGLRDSQVAGVVFGTLDGTYLSGLINSVKVGESGYPYIVDATGTTIADAEYQWVLEQENSRDSASEDESLASMVELEKKATEGEAGFGIAHYDGVKRFLIATPILDTDKWVFGIMVDYSEFMERPIQAIWICVGVSAAALVLAVLLTLRFAGRLTRPIIEMERAAGRIAQGDYDVDISYEAWDEIGSMASSLRSMVQANRAIIQDAVRVLGEIARGNFNLVPAVEFMGIFKEMENHMTQLVTSLSETMGDIQVSANQVGSGSEQVAMGAQSLSEGAVRQAGSIQQLSLCWWVRYRRRPKKRLQIRRFQLEMANEAGHGVTRSQQSMDQMLSAIEEISRRSDEISKIIQTIDGIAFQTNILALNAAVEAARAGEAGKGFAVVADEVRSLARQSAEAAQNTTALIQDTVNSVRRGTEIAGETAGHLDEVVEKFSALHDSINVIAAASRQQTEAVSQMTEGIDQISSVIQTNSATSEESAAASQELSSQAQLLNEMMTKFVLYQPEEDTEI
ncbi:MAG: methyl-accepting chemotaxis protein [Muricomes sp.]